MATPSSKLLTIEEVADRCRVSPATVRFWRHKGTGPSGFRLGRRVVFRENEVENWLASQEEIALESEMA